MDQSGKTREQLLLELEEAQQLIAALQTGKRANSDTPGVDSQALRPDEPHVLHASDKRKAQVQSANPLSAKSEERYRSFIDQSAEGIWLIELKQPISIDLGEDAQIELFYRYGQLTKCNDSMAQMYGLANAEELQGAHLSDLLIPTDPHNIEYLRAFIRTGYKLTDAESHEVDAHGQAKFFSNNLIGIVEGGHLVRAWGTQRDITEAKGLNEALRESEARNRALLQAVPDWMFRFRKNGTYVDFSGPLAVGLLSSPDIFLGKTIFEVHAEEFATQALQRIAQTLQAGILQTFEYTILIEGEVRHFESRMAPSGSDEVVAIVRDITENKRAQELMRGQQEILELIAKGAPLRSILTALTLFIERLSKRTICSILFLDEETQTVRHMAAPNLPADYIAAIDGMMIGPEVGSCGTAAYHKKIYVAADIETDPNWASYKHLALPHGLRACWSSPICNEGGKVLGTFAMYYKEPCAPSEQDYKLIEIATSLAGIAIEQHLSELYLRESENRYRALYENNPLMVFTIDTDGTILMVNEFGAQQLGYSARELIGQSGCLLFRAEDQRAALAQVGKCLKHPDKVFQWEIEKLDKAGRSLWVKESSRAIKRADGKLALLIVSEDITWRKDAEEALRESEQRYRMLFEKNLAGVYRGELGGRILDCNEAYAHILGFASCEEVLATSALDLYFEKSERAAFIQLLTENGSLTNHEMRLRKKDGSAVWVLVNVNLFEDGKSGLRMIEETLIDLTDRKRAEELLIAEKERLAVTLRSIGDGVIATDTDGKIVLLNRVAESLTGWRQEEAIGKHLDEVFQILNAKSHASLESIFAKALRMEQVFENQEHTLLISLDGTERIIADTTTPIYDKEGRVIGVVLVFRDMSEELQREEELLRATKLESIALLAGGIAHDFNNILTAILGNISLAKRYIDPENRAYGRLNESEQATLRARDLTHQLLTFASGGAPIKRAASVAALLQEAVSFALTGSNVKSKIVLPDDLWLTEIDEGQINQVLHNLVLNARQAMPLGGTIEVIAENLLLETGSFVQGAYLKPQKYLKIAVKDPGLGISEEHLQKIFDPYFTTKQKGSGLGLATSYSIIKNHGGFIFVESELGVGTTFFIYLPASEKSAARKSTSQERSLSGKGKILIMDDEPALRKMVSEILKYLGYEADTAQNGEEALALYKEALALREPYDAVILDLTVPGAMGGKEAAERLRAMDANVRCIVSSGYSNDPVMAKYWEHGFVAVIAKPYQIAQLSEVLGGVLGNASEEL
jgi:PAS domain S-box-containing protein